MFGGARIFSIVAGLFARPVVEPDDTLAVPSFVDLQARDLALLYAVRADVDLQTALLAIATIPPHFASLLGSPAGWAALGRTFGLNLQPTVH